LHQFYHTKNNLEGLIVFGQNSQNRKSRKFTNRLLCLLRTLALMDIQKSLKDTRDRHGSTTRHKDSTQYFIIGVSIKSITLSFVTFRTIFSRDANKYSQEMF